MWYWVLAWWRSKRQTSKITINFRAASNLGSCQVEKELHPNTSSATRQLEAVLLIETLPEETHNCQPLMPSHISSVLHLTSGSFSFTLWESLIFKSGMHRKKFCLFAHVHLIWWHLSVRSYYRNLDTSLLDNPALGEFIRSAIYLLLTERLCLKGRFRAF